jgi:ribose-phosphate pyrophosphokinase
MVVGPDLESEAWVSDLAARLELPYMAARKTRLGDRSVVIELPRPEAVMGRPVLLVDDLVSSGGTLAVCARALAAVGATSIDALVTHALFPPETMNELSRAGIRSFRSTNSVRHVTNAIRLDACLAVAVEREIDRFKAGEGGA